MNNDETNPVVGIDYATVLADLRAKRDALDKAITAIEQVTGQSSIASNGPSQMGGAAEEIRDDSFFGISITEAARKLLGAA